MTILMLLSFAWIVCWLVMSAEVVRFIKTCPDSDDPEGLLWDLDDQLPVLVVALLFMWPVLLVRLVAIRIR
jgi:hypothetical protein